MDRYLLQLKNSYKKYLAIKAAIVETNILNKDIYKQLVLYIKIKIKINLPSSLSLATTNCSDFLTVVAAGICLCGGVSPRLADAGGGSF